MNLDTLTAQFELTTSFGERQKLAEQVVGDLAASDLAGVTRLLGHKVESVRLGAIEILRLARFRPARKFLAAVTVQRSGDERAFAARALTELADPEKESERAFAESMVKKWRSIGDEYLAIHADHLASKFGLPAAEAPEPAPSQSSVAEGETALVRSAEPSADSTAGEVPIFGITAADETVREQAIARTVEMLPDAENPLIDAALESKSPGVRMDIIGAIHGLGGARMFNVLERVVRLGDGDLCALFLRGFRPAIDEFTSERRARVSALLEQTRGRFSDDRLASAAIDDCLVAARASDELESLCQSADRIAPEAAYRLANRLMELDDEQRLSGLDLVLPALARAPRRTLLFADLLEWAWTSLRPRRRDQVRELLDAAIVKPLPGGLAEPAVAAIGRLYALAQQAGRRAPENVLTALDSHRGADTALAAIAIYEAIATEGAARRIAEYLEDRLEEVREAARDALTGIEAPVNVRMVGERATIEANYQTPYGEPLIASDGSLTTELGVAYVLSEDGTPILADSTPYAGCACCTRPRALTRSGTQLPVCPETGRAHLMDGREGLLADQHPLGRCPACESVAPLERHGSSLWCRGCNDRFVMRDGAVQRADQ